MEKNESQLIKDCQNGSIESFGPLYDKYIKKIYNYLYYRVPDQNTAEILRVKPLLNLLKQLRPIVRIRAVFQPGCIGLLKIILLIITGVTKMI